MNDDMFCYQCEQTAGGKGCTRVGVCGKTPEIAGLQDLLIYQLKGISFYVKKLIDKGEKIDKVIVGFVENCLFTTLTNVNFDADVHVHLLKHSQEIKEKVREMVGTCPNSSDAASYNLSETKEEMLKDAKRAGIMFDQDLDPDIRSLRQTIVYGLKGISAYGHQARELGYYSDQVDEFYFRELEATTNGNLTVQDLITMTMRTGEMSVAVMQKLDEANTTKYQNPVPQKVNVNVKKGPFIIVSGHDLKDLESCLEQDVK